MNGWGEVAGRGLVVIGIAALATAVMTLVLIGVCVLLEHWWPLGDGIDLDEADRSFPPGPDSLRIITETSTGDDVVRRWVQRGNDRPTPL